ncbi:hypothetical protein [Melaminivora alkalimesophila]|uniref:Uncharacterized protein n=1 Tax=Melaminivora alkalimesophila TaxID=1165852 RepID=A0A317RE10_9BURK|nr:hypothetical protein [Melaminivora alkalimesophila]PWW47725.1 hypothetical protein DFR36_10298 [Melaminivora alkalimesophila]
MIPIQNTRPWAKTAMKAQDFSHDWESYVTIKVKSVRAIALSGLHDFAEGDFHVPMATGFIELVGARAGALRTALQIGFSPAAELPPPGFELYESLALGTLVLPAACFGSIVQLVHSPTAHFRIGGDGRHNAIATEAPLLQSGLPSLESA